MNRVLGLVLVVVLAAGTALQAAPGGRALVMARAKMDIRTLDPHRQYEISPPQIIRAAYETLVTLGEQGRNLTRLEPLLAESYTISPDGKTYTFRLRRGVRFHTGGVMTAQDVVFSFTRLGNLKDNPAWLFSDHVAAITAVDPQTVRITLKEPNAAFLSMLVSPNFAVVDSKAVRARGGTDAAGADKADRATDWLDQNSAGTGPFILRRWTRGVEVVLERNPAYWRAPAPAARIVVRDIPDPATQLEQVERGDVHVAQSLDADLIARFRRSGRGQVVEGNTLDMIYLAMTTNVQISSALADRRVRQAVAAVIDYDGIIKGLMRGAAIQIPSIIPVGLLGTDASLAPRRDLARARALMAEAGYPNGFTVKMVYPTYVLVGGLAAETLVTKLQADLAQIGVRLQLEPRETVQWRADYRGGKLAITIADWTPDFADPHGWAVPFAVKGAAAARRVYYDNPRAAQLATEAGRLTDPARRAQMYLELQRLLIADAAFVGLIQPKVHLALAPGVRGIVYNPVYFMDYYYVR
ncbi:MAG: ABC transporter substrate-binding protein [Armatimonadota bacterium]|nr:ABC transporter substrate-binding protein [Armatimonadota bacterium]MDR7533264.1 ABC transporter substrate-binding protein [Armatimonadota bacterium]MDR7536943.1 ABC transporter substrate-binding protein [Armatimonadota bacterium]